MYDLVRLLDTKFDAYKDAHSNGKGWALEKQAFKWIIPYDEGAVKYFKEKGVWNDEYEANNEGLLKRQAVLKKAWKATKAKKSGGDNFLAFWMAERAKALRAAGMEPVWDK